MLQFEHPVAFLLLLPWLLLRWWPRRQIKAYLAVSIPPLVRRQAALAAKPRWLTQLPSYCLHAFLFVLIILISDPYLGKRETYDVQDARSILVLLDTSASMIQTGLLKRVVTGFLVPFIAARPDEDRLAVARFDADAGGGIFTRNHQGVIMEITRPSMVQQLDLDQDWVQLREKGTQIGVGLFKALASFLEDEVETRMAEQQLDIAAQEVMYRQLQDLLQRLLEHFVQKHDGTFPLDIPLVDNPQEVGVGKFLLIITDGQLLEPTSRATRIDYLKMLGYYEQVGFRHMAFISLKTHPAQLNPLLSNNPFWKAYTWNQTQAGLQAAFAEIAQEIDTMAPGKSVVATHIKRQPMFYWFLPSLILLLLAVSLPLSKRIRHAP